MRKKGQRVYMLLVHEVTKEEKRLTGTIASDEIEGWDYTDVIFDNGLRFVQPVISWYLYDLEGEGQTDEESG